MKPDSLCGCHVLLRIIFVLTLATPADAGSHLPPEVQEFIANRDLCDHFRGEPFEGNSPEQIKRREFVFQSIEIYCPGTDRRLAALKKRYKNDSGAMKRLSEYEEKSEK